MHNIVRLLILTYLSFSLQLTGERLLLNVPGGGLTAVSNSVYRQPVRNANMESSKNHW